MADAPKRTLVYRLNYFAFRTNAPDELILELKISSGYLDDDGLFVQLVEFPHIVDNSAGKAIFYGQPNGSIPRIDDIRAALADYLINNKIIQGELVN